MASIFHEISVEASISLTAVSVFLVLDFRIKMVLTIHRQMFVYVFYFSWLVVSGRTLWLIRTLIFFKLMLSVAMLFSIQMYRQGHRSVKADLHSKKFFFILTWTLCMQWAFGVWQLDLIWTFTLKINVMGFLSDSSYHLQSEHRAFISQTCIHSLYLPLTNS